MNNSPSIDDGSTRNTNRTRRAIFDATARALVREGTGASLASIAADAGVSKGGLLHHFPSREALFLAAAHDATTQFRRAVHSNLDLSRNEPGKLLRAYIATALESIEGRDSAFTDYWIWAIIYGIDNIADLARQDAERWDHDLAEDGLNPERIALARFSIDGLAELMVHSPESAARHAPRLRSLLAGLTDPSRPFNLE